MRYFASQLEDAPDAVHMEIGTLFGGTVLRDFALAILIGILVGTYSSIFIASPIVLWWTRARGGATALRREITQQASTANPLAQR